MNESRSSIARIRSLLIGLLLLCLTLSLTSCATTEQKQIVVAYQPLPSELIDVREVCTLPDRQITNADLADAYVDCATKLKKANIRLDAIKRLTSEEKP